MSAATVAIIVVVALVVLVVSTLAVARHQLRRRFGPEYDRVAAEKHSQFRAAAELARRDRRVRRLRIRPLTATARAGYAAEWRTIQEGFVDQPHHAVIEGQELVALVMKERGYPAEDPDQIAADLSVAHPGTLDNYRTARQISAAAERGEATTEELRQALIRLRIVVGELLGKPDAAEPRELPDGEPRVPDGEEPRLPEDEELLDAADRGSGGTQAPATQQELWRPIPVPPARAPAGQQKAPR